MLPTHVMAPKTRTYCGPCSGVGFQQNFSFILFFSMCRLISLRLQVSAVWQWWNCYEDLVPNGKKALAVNLDETAVRAFPGAAKGLVSFSPKMKRCRRMGLHAQPASRAQQRSCVTHVACLCDVPEIQAVLPHFFIGNERVLPVYVQRLVTPALANNVFLLRRKSAWVNGEVMLMIVKTIAEILKAYKDLYQPILLWDALKSHLSPSVLRAAGTRGIWPIVIPAKVTWLLQPADTHAFSKYKAFLRKAYLKDALESTSGRVSVEKILLAMNDAVRHVFRGNRRTEGFEGNGLGQRQKKVRASIWAHMELVEPTNVPRTLPTLEQFGHIWPQRSDLPIDALFVAFHNQHPPTARAAAQRPPPVEDSQSDEWISRLRPRLKRAASFAAADLGAPAPVSASSGVSSVPTSSWTAPPPPVPPAAGAPPWSRPRAIPPCRR